MVSKFYNIFQFLVILIKYIYEYESHILTSKRKKLFYDIYIMFEDNNIKLLNYIFYIFIVMFGFTFKYEEKMI